MKLNIYNQKAEQAGEIELSDKVFGVKASEPLIHQAMAAQMANERQVLAHTKGRGEVRGGGKKPWKQKGTGRARAGSSRSPIWIGGGVTFGPTKERNFEKKINKKMKQKAILAALSDRLANKNLLILDKLEMDEFKTKAFNEMLRKLEEKVYEEAKRLKGGEGKKGEKPKKEKNKRSILVINDKKDAKVKYSARNLAGVEIINLENINILDLLKYRNVILTVEGAKKLEEKYKGN